MAMPGNTPSTRNPLTLKESRANMLLAEKPEDLENEMSVDILKERMLL